MKSESAPNFSDIFQPQNAPSERRQAEKHQSDKEEEEEMQDFPKFDKQPNPYAQQEYKYTSVEPLELRPELQPSSGDKQQNVAVKIIVQSPESNKE